MGRYWIYFHLIQASFIQTQLFVVKRQTQIFQCEQSWKSLAFFVNYSRTKILQIFKGEAESAARGFMPMNTQPVQQTKNLHRDSAQHNQKKISDIHGRYLFKPLVWKMLLCTDLIYGFWDWAGILSVKVRGERILDFLKTFVPLVTASAVMSPKTCLCDSFVISSGQKKEEPFSEIWLQHYTCQIPFSMQIKNGSS